MTAVSVIMASYNYGDRIGEAIRSVQDQSFSDWELLAVDDGSTDDSRDVIAAFGADDDRVRLLTHPDGGNRGLPETVALGVSRAAGKYVAFLECDDLWRPENLARKVAILEAYPEVALVDDAVEFFGDPARIARYDGYRELRENVFAKYRFPADIFSALLLENFIPTFSCAVCRREALEKCEFDAYYPPHLDRSLWLQICRKHRFFHLSEPLTRWRIHARSYISRETDNWRRDRWRKMYHLLLPAYSGNRLHPGLYAAWLRMALGQLRLAWRRRRAGR